MGFLKKADNKNCIKKNAENSFSNLANSLLGLKLQKHTFKYQFIFENGDISSSLAIKSSNAVILKGGIEAAQTNKTIFDISSNTIFIGYVNNIKTIVF